MYILNTLHVCCRYQHPVVWPTKPPSRSHRRQLKARPAELQLHPSPGTRIPRISDGHVYEKKGSWEAIET